MATQIKTDSSGNEYTEVWVGAPGAMTIGATIDGTGIHGTLVPADPLASTVSAQAPLLIAGNADNVVTARTGGSVKAPDVATGGAGNVAGADLTIRPGKGTGTGTPGTVIMQAAPVAGAGDNAQVPATVATLSSTGLELAAAKTLTTPLAVVSTSLTGPKVIGGTAVGSDLTLQSTSGAGDGTDYVYVKVGNNGGTTSATFDANGMQGAVGATTPATGAFTTASASTSVTSPKLVGGSGVGQDLTIQSTSGVGDGTDYVYVKVGNNGGTTSATFDANGIQAAIGATTPATGAFTTASATTSVTSPKMIGGSAVGSDLVLQSTSGVGDGTDTVLIKVGNNGATTVATASANSLDLSKPLSGAQDAITTVGGGTAASVATLITEITTDGTAGLSMATLADGTVDGQIKIFSVVASGAAGDSVKVTPAKFQGGTQITFAADPKGKGCVMVWSAAADKWICVANTGGTVA